MTWTRKRDGRSVPVPHTDAPTPPNSDSRIVSKQLDKVGIFKQPHVRIEFDDINDVPHVWIDGVDVSSTHDYRLVRINLEWNKNYAYIEPKNFIIEYDDISKETHYRLCTAQSNGVPEHSRISGKETD